MTELIICLTLIPIIFLIFKTPKTVTEGVMWIPVAMAAVSVAYFLYEKSNPLLWGGVGAFLAMAVSELLDKKKIQPFSILSLLFVCQAIVSSSVGVVIICLAFADGFLNTELFLSPGVKEKNRAIHNIYRSLFSFLPIAVGVLLNLSGPFILVACALTIIIRLFSWPFSHWISEQKGDAGFYNLFIGAGSALAIWHTQDFAAAPEWGLIWLAVAGILSLGATYKELYITICLAAFSVSPGLALFAISFWPLLVHKGKSLYLLPVVVTAVGFFVCEASDKIWDINLIYVIGAVSAIAVSRPFAAAKSEKRMWYSEASDLFLTALLFGVTFYFIPMVTSNVSPLGVVFASLFSVCFMIGKIMFLKKPKFFLPLKSIQEPILPDRSEVLESLRERPGTIRVIKESPLFLAFFRVIESESHLVWLLGFLGLALLWGTR